MIHVALQVHQGGLLLQDTVAVAFLHGVHKGLLILVALADEHIIADADDVGHEGDHGSGLADGLAVGDLGLLLVQVLQLKAEQVGGLREREARTGGVVAEQGDCQARVEDLGRDVVLAQLAQGVGDDVERLELVGGLVPSVQEVATVHTLKIEAVQLLDELGKLSVHGNVLSKDETIAMSRCAPACACG